MTEMRQRTRALGRVFERRHGPAPKPGEKDTRPVHYWIGYYVRGREYRESAGTKRKDAVRLLQRRHQEMGSGTFAGPDAEKVSFEDIAGMMVNDYEVNGRVSLNSAKRALGHLRKVFSNSRAVDITRDKVDHYIAGRLKDKAARATVAKEIAALSRAFNLAVRAGRLATRPYFTRLKVENTRTESFTEDELDVVLNVLMRGAPATAMEPEKRAQPELVPPVLFAAMTGWRLPSDVLTLRWSQVDLAAGTVTRWARGTSKARKHVVFPFDAMPDLKAMLKRQREVTTALERETGRIIPFVLHRGLGKPIRDAYAGWRAACRRAGVPGRRPQDLRRTGARSLRALGMSDRDIAELCGWETVEMVSRYLGRDPAGVAERLRSRVPESGARTRTIHGRFRSVAGAGEE